MAGVPEVEVPSVQPEAAPVVPVQGPPPGAFGGLVIGEGLSKIGEALFDEGHRSYLLAAETKAQEKENDFQKRALQVRDDYLKLPGWKAVQAHEEISNELEKARTDFGNELQSKLGLRVYNNNSLRNLRLIQESIDSHFVQQNRVYQDTTYKDAQTISTRMLASMAQGPGFNPTAIAEKTQEIYNRGKKYALDNLGLPEDSAVLHAQKEAGVAMDAYFDVLTNKRSGRSKAEIKAEYDKWDAAGFLDKHVQQKVLASGFAQDARGAVRDIFAVVPRLVNDPKFEGNPDPDGEPDISGIQTKVGDYIRANPEQEEVALHEFNALRAQVEDAFTKEVRHRVDRVVAQAREDMSQPGPWNGVFHVDPTSRDYLWLLRNKSTALDPVIRSEYVTDQRLQRGQHAANATAFKADLISMAADDPEKFEKLTEADLFKMQDDKKYAGGFDARFQLEGAGKVLKGLKEQHQKNELAWIEKTTVDYLKHNIYTNKDDEPQAHSGVLHGEIATALQEHLKSGAVKRDDWKAVNDFLAAETTKIDQSHLFGLTFGGEYQAARDARLRASTPTVPARPVNAEPPKAQIPTIKDQAAYDALPQGAQYIGPDGTLYEKGKR